MAEAFIVSCEKDNIDITKKLMFVINVNQIDEYGKTGLIHACIKGNYKIVKELLKHDDLNLNIVDNNGNTAFVYACMYNHLDIVKLLINYECDNVMNSRALYYLCENSNNEIIKYLTKLPYYKFQVDVNYLVNGKSPLFHLCENNNVEQVKLLLEYLDINLNLKYDNVSIFEYCCGKNYVEIVKLLIENINFNVEKENIVKIIFESVNLNKFELFKLLHDYVNLSISDSEGNTLFTLACKNNNHKLIKFLFYKSNVNHVNDEG